MDNNSQVPGTPTVVLSLYEPKYVKFFKRYSDGKTFDNDSKETSEMLMNHGEFFFLHPDDERVVNRKVLSGDTNNIYTTEKLPSQFQHGVKCDWSKDDTRDKKVSISLCFRMVKNYMIYSSRTNTLTDENGEFEMNDSSSEKMNDRAKCISAERKQIIKKRKLNDTNMNSFAECLENYN